MRCTPTICGASDMDQQLKDILLALLGEAHPKTDCAYKFVPNYLLDQLSERLAELGIA